MKIGTPFEYILFSCVYIIIVNDAHDAITNIRQWCFTGMEAAVWFPHHQKSYPEQNG